MAIIPLRQYNREIEGMIDSGQMSEAIAHCRYILQVYPKYIQTYRLLGKVYLENQQYSDAIDIFQRLLAVVPDDFIAHVGMSIIREDENNLDAAIWHMERAFETQPSNATIQEELRRLYGRRDGLEPPKIRLTRGALARMYARGNLFEQAIAEVRSALSDDPVRVDLQTLLALMYYQTKQFEEAIDVCSRILKKFPYCYEANRLLAAILPETNRSADAATYQQRLLTMDPYYAHTSPHTPTTEDVPENSITIERLIYKPGQTPSGLPDQPSWASSLGIDFEQESDERLPEWLQEGEAPALVSGSESVPVTEESASQPIPDQALSDAHIPAEDEEEIIPDWMKEAGWQSASPDEIENLPSLSTDEKDIEIAKGEIPDWLKDIAPQGVLDEELPPLEEEPSEATLPWLEEKIPGPSDTIKSWLEETKVEEPSIPSPDEASDEAEADTHLWLRETGDESVPAEGKLAPGLEEEHLPEWLSGLEKPGEESSGVTDWLKTAAMPDEGLPTDKPFLAEEETPEDTTPDWIQEETLSAPEIESTTEQTDQEIPSWLRELGAEEQNEEDISEIVEKTAPDLEDQDLALAWLEGLAAQQGVKEEELISSPEERSETPPEWVLEQQSKEPSDQETESTPSSAELPEWLRETGDEDELSTTVESLEISEDLVETGQERIEEEIPAWLRSLTPDADESPELAGEAETPPSGDEITDIPAWLEEDLEDKASTTTRSENLPQTEDTSELEEIPSWLSEMDLTEEVESTLPADEQRGEVERSDDTPALEEELSLGQEASTEIQSTTPTPDLSDQDAALAWLENLAAQHGAKEEELITSPEDRLETPPEWVLEETGTEPPIEATELSEAPIQSISEVEPPIDQAVQAPEEELPTKLLDDTVGASIDTGTPLLEEDSRPPADEPTEMVTEIISDAVTDEHVPFPSSEGIIEDLVPPTEDAVPIPAADIEPIEEPEFKDQTLIDLNTASLHELERLPGIGFVRAQSIMEFRDTQGPLNSVDDLQNISGISTILIDGIRNMVTTGIPKITTVEEKPILPDDYDGILSAAQKLLDEGRCGDAITKYAQLIKNNQHLESIIEQLQKALYHFPVDVSLWETLGDAHMRKDELQEALEAYTKAEELLR